MAQTSLNSTGVASSGALSLQSNGTTEAIGISTAQVATFVKDAVVNGLTVGKGAGSVSTNTAVGDSALVANTTGAANTSVGYRAGYTNQTGLYNTFIGNNAGKVATGSANSFVGSLAGFATTTGTENVAFGTSASASSPLQSNTTGSYNTALGNGSLGSNTTASNNTAVGYQAGYSNTTGVQNVFVGRVTGYTNSSGSYNCYIGDSAGNLATAGQNTFIGVGSGSSVTTGAKNTILGGYNGNQGGLDIRTSSNYIVLSDGDGNPRYYYGGGHYFTGINSGAGTYAMKWSSASGQITYDTSSARYKDNIRDSVYGLAAVMQIRSAQFEYKDDGRSDVGLIAEEVYEVIPDLVALDGEGNPNAVSYDRFVSVCIKAIQELKAEFDAYKATHP